MRLLFAIPHYFRPSAEPRHGSGASEPGRRREILRRSIAALRQTFGSGQGLIGRRQLHPANDLLRSTVEVVVCTTGDDHLVDESLHGLCRHQPSRAEPKLLGYECHEVLRRGLGRFDFHCYLEDDILISDPLFFQKLGWFVGAAGEDCLLQPNRFELGVGGQVEKLYCDGNIADPTISPRYQNRADRPRIEAPALGARFAFQRVENPHAGAFFLTRAQMETWAAKPYFLDRADGFWGPLESAATLGIMRCFRVYKPARENAGFLEVQHLDPRILPRLRLVAPEAQPAAVR
jgi:hypothetical protein